MQVVCFGLGLVKLDVRQESTEHSNAISFITEYLGLGSYRCACPIAKVAMSISRLSKYALISKIWPKGSKAPSFDLACFIWCWQALPASVSTSIHANRACTQQMSEW